MTYDAAQAWLDAYIAAGRGYDSDAIGDLFAENATYAYQPWATPVEGRGAIVAACGWLEIPLAELLALFVSVEGPQHEDVDVDVHHAERLEPSSMVRNHDPRQGDDLNTCRDRTSKRPQLVPDMMLEATKKDSAAKTSWIIDWITRASEGAGSSLLVYITHHEVLRHGLCVIRS